MEKRLKRLLIFGLLNSLILVNTINCFAAVTYINGDTGEEMDSSQQEATDNFIDNLEIITENTSKITKNPLVYRVKNSVYTFFH